MHLFSSLFALPLRFYHFSTLHLPLRCLHTCISGHTSPRTHLHISPSGPRKQIWFITFLMLFVIARRSRHIKSKSRFGGHGGLGARLHRVHRDLNQRAARETGSFHPTPSGTCIARDDGSGDVRRQISSGDCLLSAGGKRGPCKRFGSADGRTLCLCRMQRTFCAPGVIY